MGFDPPVTAAAAIAASPFIGSFLAVVVLRLPGRRTFVFGRSACDACGHPLGPRDLVPLVSFVLLRGRCRYCNARIDPLHPLMEVGAFLLAVWAATVMSGWLLLATCVFGWCLLTLAAIDVRTGLL